MQVSKVAVVATGALATAAAIGSTPAFAADSEGAPAVAPATVGVLDYEGKHRASDEAMRELAEQWLTVAPEQTWSAPWEQEPPQILSLGSGSAVSLAPWQQCASHGPFLVGATVPIASPATVLGDCQNGNIDIANGGSDALFSILDGTAISALAFQQCGSGVGGVGIGVPIASATTVGGDCKNGNITIGEEDEPEYPVYPSDDYYYPFDVAAAQADPTAVQAAESGREEQTIVPSQAPWEVEPPQILSAGSGSAVSALAWQQCASHGPFIGGLTVPIASPATVGGDCKNANIDINGEPSDALFSVLDHSALSVLPFQQCGSGVGGLGISVPVASPTTVGGDCKNGNISIG
ncbi:MAG TPA: hypothetical protein VIL37_02345 [Natronosporangium sp.]